MRLQQHLTEAVNVPVVAWTMIKKKCQPFLKEWIPVNKRTGDFLPLYRGMHVGRDFGIKDVRKNRKPEASDFKLHNDIDNMMQQKFKIAGRTGSIFCTGDASSTSYYGDAYLIFPCGKYKILWSPSIRDLAMDAWKMGFLSNLNLASIHINDYLKKRPDLELYDKEVRKEVLKMLQNQNDRAVREIVKKYKTGNLKGAITSGNEVMVECESYIYVQYNWENELQELIENEI